MSEKTDKIFIKGIRNIIQLCFLGLTVGIGIQFFIYVMQASSGGDITVTRPPGVEAFLPIGALMGLFSLISPTKIVRDEQGCINCKKCLKNCAYNLPIDIKKNIYSPECNGCMECVNSCPVKNTLNMKSFNREIATLKMAAIVTLIFVAVIYIAQITDHWADNVTDRAFRMRLRLIDSPGYTHSGSDMMGGQ